MSSLGLAQGINYRIFVPPSITTFNGDCRYDCLLAEFFNDPNRSGPFYLDADTYASFAITFTIFIVRGATGSPLMPDLERDSSCLSILLSKESYSEELAMLLNSKLLSVTEVMRPDLAQEVAAIVKTYCNGPQSFPDSRYVVLLSEDSDAVTEINPSREASTTATSNSPPVPPPIHEFNNGQHTGSAFANLEIHKSQETSTIEIPAIRHKGSVGSLEENGDARPVRGHPTLTQTSTLESYTPPFRRPPTFRPTPLPSPVDSGIL
ncbi:hypothetical protein BYT27DRAFT_7264913 [Phlegmacium glaucopus]|nr:hypothetical protein BYT27DRAFT_7264913 [Phlegmacium glaucopus]